MRNGLVRPTTGSPWQGFVPSTTFVSRVALDRSELKVKSEGPSGMKQPLPHAPLTKSHAWNKTSISCVELDGPTFGFATLAASNTLTFNCGASGSEQQNV